MDKINKTTEQLIADHEGMIRGLVNVIRTTQSTLDNPTAIERMKAERRAIIERTQRELDQLEEQQQRGPQTILDAHDRIAELRVEINRLKYKRKLERLAELAAEINGLKEELPEELLQEAETGDEE